MEERLPLSIQYLAHSTSANTALIKALAHLEQIGIKDNELIWKKPPHWPRHTIMKHKPYCPNVGISQLFHRDRGITATSLDVETKQG